MWSETIAAFILMRPLDFLCVRNVPMGFLRRWKTRILLILRSERLTLYAIHVVRNHCCVYSDASPRFFMCPKCANGISEALEDPDPADFGGGGPGNYHSKRRQRCRRHLDLFVCRRAVWAPFVVDILAGDAGPDRGSGNVGTNGGGHREGPQ